MLELRAALILGTSRSGGPLRRGSENQAPKIDPARAAVLVRPWVPVTAKPPCATKPNWQNGSTRIDSERRFVAFDLVLYLANWSNWRSRLPRADRMVVYHFEFWPASSFEAGWLDCIRF